jgi:hypothetical protein
VARERTSTYLHTNTNTQPRGSGGRIHCGVEVTVLSTNKQHTLFFAPCQSRASNVRVIVCANKQTLSKQTLANKQTLSLPATTHKRLTLCVCGLFSCQITWSQKDLRCPSAPLRGSSALLCCAGKRRAIEKPEAAFDASPALPVGGPAVDPHHLHRPHLSLESHFRPDLES